MTNSGDVPFDDAASGVALIAALMVLFVVVLPLLAIAVEILVGALVLLAALAGRVVLRRPWTVFAECGDVTQEWRAVGWRASRRRIAEVAGALERGMPLPPEEGVALPR